MESEISASPTSLETLLVGPARHGEQVLEARVEGRRVDPVAMVAGGVQVAGEIGIGTA